MAELTKETIRYLSKLCRIHVREDDEEAMLNDLKRILGYIEQLQSIDTEGVPPCSHVISGVGNVMRDDVIGETLSREVFLSNAPEHVGGMIRVPPVLAAQEPS
ncbi:MAG: Asp-tRNA(Asn)/Glu-tRNA(Gln) amidotransferase subunit GatC [Chlamydiales bacterium]|nr:Asp-tRNA(Asn)/Glu-tRNA(Gln) amidotransferase subunit GatC [Chlamydiales bacterium]